MKLNKHDIRIELIDILTLLKLNEEILNPDLFSDYVFKVCTANKYLKSLDEADTHDIEELFNSVISMKSGVQVMIALEEVSQ